MTKAFAIWKSLTVLQFATTVVAVAAGGTPFWPRIPPSSILTSHGPPLLNEAPTVGTANGPFAGFVTTTRKGDPVYNYLGIPYALPPTGPLRFKAPEPIHQASDIVKDATQLPPACPQPEGATALSVSEDCLYLNVFTSGSPANTSVALPVMVFIHGGNFITGDAGSVTGTRLLAHGGGVLVSVHYRLGALGFLSTGDQVSPGNYGLKDIALALKWVHENIEFFGGNPENVTVFGVSAGSAASLLMMLSPLTQGFVHGVIAQSGTPFDTWNAIKDPLSEAEELARELDCLGKSSQEIMDCIRGIPWENITAVTSASWAKSYGNYDTRLKYTLPVIEPNVTGAFITADPVEILKSGNFQRIPIIIGNVIQEGLSTLATFYQLTVGPQGYDKDPGNYKHNILMPIIKGFNNERETSAIAEISARTYLPPTPWSNFTAFAHGLGDILSVFWMKATVLESAEILSGLGVAVYLYSLELSNTNSLWSLSAPSDIPIIRNGAVHGDDMIFLFDSPFNLTSEEERFSETLAESWMNFARTGNPTPSGTLFYPKWSRYTDLDKEFMQLSASPSIQTDYTKSWKTSPSSCQTAYQLSRGAAERWHEGLKIITVVYILKSILAGFRFFE